MERIILTSEEVIDLNTFALEHDHGKFGAIIIEALAINKYVNMDT